MRTARFFRSPLIHSLLVASACTLVAAPALAQNAGGPVAVSGRSETLAANAPVDSEGHHYTVRTVNLTAGESVSIDLASPQFDTILRVAGPAGFTAENDDIGGNDTNSHVEFTAPATGAYQLTVTSYRPGETGSYSLRVQRSAGSAPVATNVPPQPVPGNTLPGTAQSGELDDSTPLDAQGHHYVTRALTLNAGESVALDLGSDEFDTILRVAGPAGFSTENDDIRHGDTDSHVEFVAPASGVYQLTVTSYGAGQTGEFELRVARNGVAVNPSMPAIAPTPAQPTQPAAGYPLPAGQPTAYVWDPASGRYIPLYGGPGVAPTQPTLPMQPGIPALPAQPGPQASAGRVFGIFVGMSNYPDASRNLEYTADDARNLAAAMEREGLMDPSNAIVLTDASATAANVRQAFSLMSTRVSANDTFVFFYDGHGGADEIDLYSGAMRGRRLGQMLDSVSGHQLLVLDSCNSGGLASLVQGHENREALFSSRASEESEVASEVHAGGWLAYYVTRAVSDHAVEGNDGTLQFAELTNYVRRGYRTVQGQHLVAVDGGNTNTALWSRSAGSNELALQ